MVCPVLPEQAELQQLPLRWANCESIIKRLARPGTQLERRQEAGVPEKPAGGRGRARLGPSTPASFRPPAPSPQPRLFLTAEAGPTAGLSATCAAASDLRRRLA